MKLNALKTFLAACSVAALGGCAVVPYDPGYGPYPAPAYSTPPVVYAPGYYYGSTTCYGYGCAPVYRYDAFSWGLGLGIGYGIGAYRHGPSRGYVPHGGHGPRGFHRR